MQAFQKLQKVLLLDKKNNQQQMLISDTLQQMKQIPGEIDLPLVAELLYSSGNIEVRPLIILDMHTLDLPAIRLIRV